MLMQPSIASPVPQPQAVPLAQRLLFFDNLRVVLMVMVILHHVAQAYGPTGFAWPFAEAEPALIFDPWAAVGLAAAPFVKFVLVSLLAVPATFLVSYWVRKPLKL